MFAESLRVGEAHPSGFDGVYSELKNLGGGFGDFAVACRRPITPQIGPNLVDQCGAGWFIYLDLAGIVEDDFLVGDRLLRLA